MLTEGGVDARTTTLVTALLLYNVLVPIIAMLEGKVIRFSFVQDMNAFTPVLSIPVNNCSSSKYSISALLLKFVPMELPNL